VKVLVTGPHLSGKSALIQGLAKGNVINIQANGTTVGLDHGVAEAFKVPIRLFGTPGLARFKVLRRIISEGADGILFVVDASNPEGDGEARYIWTEISDLLPNVPCIVAANKQDLTDSRTPERIRHDLSFMVGVPVIPISCKTDYNLEKLLPAMVMLITYEWSPILRAFGATREISFADLAKSLRISETKVRGYLRWFELRKMVFADWEKKTAHVAPGIARILAQR
jgi:small GTP-binding protein